MSDQNLPTDRPVRLTINFFPPFGATIIDRPSSNATTWPANCDFLPSLWLFLLFFSFFFPLLFSSTPSQRSLSLDGESEVENFTGERRTDTIMAYLWIFSQPHLIKLAYLSTYHCRVRHCKCIMEMHRELNLIYLQVSKGTHLFRPNSVAAPIAVGKIHIYRYRRRGGKWWPPRRPPRRASPLRPSRLRARRCVERDTGVTRLLSAGFLDRTCARSEFDRGSVRSRKRTGRGRERGEGGEEGAGILGLSEFHARRAGVENKERARESARVCAPAAAGVALSASCAQVAGARLCAGADPLCSI